MLQILLFVLEIILRICKAMLTWAPTQWGPAELLYLDLCNIIDNNHGVTALGEGHHFPVCQLSNFTWK